MDQSTLKYYSDNAAQVAERYESVVSDLSAHFVDSFSKGGKILDIGCGKEVPLAKTMYTSKMSPLKYIGVDYNKIESCTLHEKMKEKFDLAFTKNYKDSWENFAEQRSLIIHDKYILKYVSSNYESFTISSKRAGHITLGEFFLGRYLLEDLLLNKKKYIFLLQRLTAADLNKLNEVKNEDKEWLLMNNEPNSSIKTIDDLTGLPKNLYGTIQSIKTKPMTNGTLARKKYNKCMNKIVKWLKKNKFNFN
jgi:hypothetical protein